MGCLTILPHWMTEKCRMVAPGTRKCSQQDQPKAESSGPKPEGLGPGGFENEVRITQATAARGPA